MGQLKARLPSEASAYVSDTGLPTREFYSFIRGFRDDYDSRGVGYSVNILALGAKCDGRSPDADTAALKKARLMAEAGEITELVLPPDSTTLVNDYLALAISSGTLTVRGFGRTSVLKAAPGAALGSIYQIYGTARVKLANHVIDGNRANGGLSTTTSYAVINFTDKFSLIDVEMKEIERIAVAFFSTLGVRPRGALIDHCDFHDIGANADNGVNNIGQALFGDINDVLVCNSKFEDIYPLKGPLGDATAINLNTINGTVDKCLFRNILNVSGGMAALSDGVTGSTDIYAKFSNNYFEQAKRFKADIDPTSANDDITTGIEIAGRKFSVTGNTITGFSGAGVLVELNGGDGVISGNVIDSSIAGSAAVSGSVTPRNVRATGNDIRNVTYGFVWQGSGVNAVMDNNSCVNVTNAYSGSKVTLYQNSGIDNHMPVAELPAAASNPGLRLSVSDSNTAVFNAIIAAGGGSHVPVHSDGTDWRVG